MISRSRLCELLDYDSTTGVFTWKIDRGNVRVGSIAGTPSGGDGGGCKYWLIRIDKKRYYAHHLAWFWVHGEWPTQLDHKDLNGKNNAIDNLRKATTKQNAANTMVRSNNRLGIKGVRRRTKNSYEARLNDKVIGYFRTAEEAQAAYLSELKALHGDFART